jgi:coenzyme F420 biosynthesis associated uncharacterized protein
MKAATIDSYSSNGSPRDGWASSSRDVGDGNTLVDERLALTTARVMTPHRRTDAVIAARLRADVATDIPALDDAARRWTQLGADLPPTRIRVVSRVGWVEANLIGLRGALDPLAERVTSPAVTARLLSLQLGGLLGLLSTKVLGQYVLPLGGAGQAQLILVGPNVVDLSERYGALAADVRRTIILHELTHRLQFDGVPWLGDHLRGILVRYLESSRLDPGALIDAIGRVPDVIREARQEQKVAPLLRLVLTDAQREIVEEAQALMTLLEGHGNATMFAAGEELIADPEQVRRSLDRRRSDLTSKVLGAVAGMEMKRRQYRDGELFVRHVVDAVGIEGLNRVWTSPETLPTLEEIDAPDAWIARVHAPADR